jgi:hypothetical protein
VVDAEAVILEELERLAPREDGAGADWHAVTLRARTAPGEPSRGQRKVRGRLLIPAIAVAALAVVVASAFAGLNPFTTFRSWLSGNPGRPASAKIQKQFLSSNTQQSWTAFPTGTKLRVLVRATVGGKRYVLSGFRSGNSVCLTLNTVYDGKPGCVSASTLKKTTTPVIPVGGSSSPINPLRPLPEVSYGIAADDVSAVNVNAIDGTHRARLGAGAYLWVEAQPNTGNRVLSLTAVAHGKQSTVNLPSGISGSAVSPPPARGPTGIQATISDPTIGWLDRHEPVGLAASQLKSLRIYQQIRSLIATAGFTRFIKPDPLSNVIVGVSARHLFFDWGGSKPPYFKHGPIHFFDPPGVSSQGFVTFTGVAADGVTAIKFFLADGEVQTAALKDNVFTALVPRSTPIRVAAYNNHGLVIDIQTYALASGPVIPVAATRDLKPVLHTRGPDGATATLNIGSAVNNVRCWRADFSNGHSQSGCQTPSATGPLAPFAVQPLGVQPAGHDVFVIAYTQAPVARAGLRFADGATITAHPVDRIVILAVPRTQLTSTQQRARLVGYDNHGQEIINPLRNGRQTNPANRHTQTTRFELSVYFRAN